MKQFGIDKIKHIIAAFVITAVVGLALSGGAEWSNIDCALTGATTAEVTLVGKEFYDKVIKRTFFDWKDIKLAQIGVVLGFICVWLFI